MISSAPAARRRTAFTLVEMLISMAISLVMVYALVEFMRYVGDSVGDGRAMIELSGQLRGVRQRLNEDLMSLTVPVRPWGDAGGAGGYFEYYEGPRSDQDRDGDGNLDGTGQTSLWGESDDVLAFTIQTRNDPYVGRTPNGMRNSQVAEVIWFSGFDDRNSNNLPDVGEMRYVYRRQLLVLPSAVPSTVYASAADANDGLRNFQQQYDLSASVYVSQYNAMGAPTEWKLRGNTLADLARRENRFAHNWNAAFPHALDINYDTAAETARNRVDVNAATPVVPIYALSGNRLGEDVLLSRAIAFDVRAYDVNAKIVADGTNADGAGPSDLVAEPGTETILGYGAYVDLRYSRYLRTNYNANSSVFSGTPSPRSLLNSAVYDTWSLSYEADGIDQDSRNGADQGTNGQDDDMANGVDDIGERETLPPYPVPLRGIQVIIRSYDPDTRQMRQATVVGDFTPE